MTREQAHSCLGRRLEILFRFGFLRVGLILIAILSIGLLGTGNATTVWLHPDEGIGSGSLSITGIGWAANAAWLNPPGYDFATNRHSYDLTTTGDPVAMQGFVNLAETATVNPGDWSKFYGKMSIRDDSNRVVNTVFGNDWLGVWHGLDPQPYDRLSLETENVPGFVSNTAHAQQYYATEGGTHDMHGGGPIYPSDRNYYFQLIADPSAETFALQAYAMGSTAPIDGVGWPAQNTLDYPTWLDIGSINVGGGFNFANVEFYSILWASTQAASGETSVMTWQAMNAMDPLSFNQQPAIVPEPGTIALFGLGLAGFAGKAYRRRRKA